MNKVKCGATVLAMGLALLCLAADAPTPSVPPKAVLPTRKYQAALEAAKAKYDREVEVAKRMYALELEKAKQAYIAAKDPGMAAAVSELVDAMESPKETKNYLNGTWGWDRYQVTFKPHGEVVCSWQAERGKWLGDGGAYTATVPDGQVPNWYLVPKDEDTMYLIRDGDFRVVFHTLKRGG